MPETYYFQPPSDDEMNRENDIVDRFVSDDRLPAANESRSSNWKIAILSEKKVDASGLSLDGHNAACSVCGKVIYDLSSSALQGEVVIDCAAVMGDIVIKVGEGIGVDDRIVPIMADIKVEGLAVSGQARATIVLKGVVVMGSVKVLGPNYRSLISKVLEG